MAKNISTAVILEKLDNQYQKILAIFETIGAKLEKVKAHVENLQNPHKVTKAQVGLSEVVNFGLAKSHEVKSSRVHRGYMTPLLTHMAIDARLNTHNGEVDNDLGEISLTMDDYTFAFGNLVGLYEELPFLNIHPVTLTGDVVTINSLGEVTKKSGQLTELDAFEEIYVILFDQVRNPLYVIDGEFGVAKVDAAFPHDPPTELDGLFVNGLMGVDDLYFAAITENDEVVTWGDATYADNFTIDPAKNADVNWVYWGGNHGGGILEYRDGSVDTFGKTEDADLINTNILPHVSSPSRIVFSGDYISVLQDQTVRTWEITGVEGSKVCTEVTSESLHLIDDVVDITKYKAPTGETGIASLNRHGEVLLVSAAGTIYQQDLEYARHVFIKTYGNAVVLYNDYDYHSFVGA